MRCTVDRLEENLAVLEVEGRGTITVPASCLPEGIKEGDVLIRIGERFLPDPKETAARAARIKKKMDALWN